MLLVIFGAGASFDSVHGLPATMILRAIRGTYGVMEDDRPPLANQLFDDRPDFVSAMSAFPACLALIPSLRKHNVVVERELARIQEQADHYPRVHQELASIRYYLHFALWRLQERWMRHHRGITNYAALLREIDRWRLSFNQKVCFVTFNYDTMLDTELERLLGVQFQKVSDYSQESYALIKPHGSINWGREVDGGLMGSLGEQSSLKLIEAAGGLQISDRYRIVPGAPMCRMPNESTIVFPALSIPVVNKVKYSCPETHIQLLYEILPKVTKIVTVGWRATELEFLELLRTRLSGKPSLMIVSGNQAGADETHQNLVGDVDRMAAQPYGTFIPGALKTGPWETVAAGFTGLINDLDTLEKFLRS